MGVLFLDLGDMAPDRRHICNCDNVPNLVGNLFGDHSDGATPNISSHINARRCPQTLIHQP